MNHSSLPYRLLRVVIERRWEMSGDRKFGGLSIQARVLLQLFPRNEVMLLGLPIALAGA